MGSISFILPQHMPPAAQATLRSACFATGYDQAPVPTPLDIHDTTLTASWGLSESRYLLLPWQVGAFGTPVTVTATLREQAKPYHLLTELARGKLNQVRTQTAEWLAIGLQTRTEFDQALLDTTRVFGKAVLASTPAEADSLATRVLERSYSLADELVREYVQQMCDTRHHEEGKLDTRLAARTTRGFGPLATEYSAAFNAAQIGFRWRDLEPEESRYDWTATDAAVAAARDAKLPLTGGPVIDLAPGMLPDWAAGWEGDLPTLAAFMCDFLETVIGRYKSDIRRWVVCAGFNHTDTLGLDDDDRLRLAFRLFEAASQIDRDLELVLSVAQPWGEYLTDENHTISPLTFPDDLIRAGMRISAVEIEMRAATLPRGSLPRDLLDTYRLLHLFGLLGLPLEVVLSLPAAAAPDSQAIAGQSLWAPGWRGAPAAEGQAEWAASFAGLALAMPQVRAVTWDHWSDSEPHLTPNGGVIDSTGQPRPVLARLKTLRTTHLV